MVRINKSRQQRGKPWSRGSWIQQLPPDLVVRKLTPVSRGFITPRCSSAKLWFHKQVGQRSQMVSQEWMLL